MPPRSDHANHRRGPRTVPLPRRKRIRAGLELQRSRILDRAATAPRVLEDSPYEVVNLTDTPDNDLDYYAYELGRLQDAAREMAKVFTNPKEVTEALDAFNAALQPHCRIFVLPAIR